jgi:SRSO17 transposase
MPEKRNYANIARHVKGIYDDGQNLQQFMSDSPWPAESVFTQIRQEIAETPQLHGGMLTLDESGDVRSGTQSAGAAHQYIGRLGKVAMGQVGVALGYYQHHNWIMVDAELFLPEKWFEPEYQELWQRLHIPGDREFKTKLEIGLELIRRAKSEGLPFSVVSCDTLYGRDQQFRADLSAEDLTYIADVPANLKVYLKKPFVGIPKKTKGKKGPPIKHWRVLNNTPVRKVHELVDDDKTVFYVVEVRHCERGILVYQCAARRVWTIPENGQVQEEWLLIRRENNGNHSFSMSNASEGTPLKQLALWRCQRYFAERVFQDAKSEGGWDELVARKYRAWMHHTALDALALWFMAQTKLEWEQKYPRDSALREELNVNVLPALSMANIRELLRAVMPLKQFTVEDSIQLVTKHFVNRSKSTSSRLKKQVKNRGKPVI